MMLPVLVGAPDNAPSYTSAVSLDDAGVMLAEALQIAGTLEAAALEYETDGSPLPRGMLTCGEASRLVSAVVGLALTLYPQLEDVEVLESILRHAITAGPTGAVQ